MATEKPWDEMSLSEQVADAIESLKRQGRIPGAKVLVVEKGQPAILEDDPPQPVDEGDKATSTG